MDTSQGGEPGDKAAYVDVENLRSGQKYRVYARAFVVACNATLTPQLLFKSGIRLPALGKYICEQPLAFCQIVLKKELVPKGELGSDPIGIPMSDPPPQVIKTYINYKTIRAIIILFQYHIIKTAILIYYNINAQ